MPSTAREGQMPAEADLKSEVLAWRKRMKRLLAVLNQRNEQVMKLEISLRSERAVNQRLMESVEFANNQLEQLGTDLECLTTELREARTEIARLSHVGRAIELSQIRGIGPRLAQQLSDLGIRDAGDLAGLDPLGMDDQAHPLHEFRSRALRDDWIGQAICLTQAG